jgi:hypothetical protein
MASNGANIEIQKARLFNGRAVLIVCGFGFLLVIPVLLSMLLVSSVQFGIWTVLVPLLTIGAATWLLPFGFGNSYVAKLARSLPPGDWNEHDGFIVQITFLPRLRAGLRALLEDADDIGNVSFTESELIFQGDSVRFSIPYRQLSNLRIQSIGWRGLFLYPGLSISVSGVAGVTELRIAERAGWSLPASRNITRKLNGRLAQALKGSDSAHAGG